MTWLPPPMALPHLAPEEFELLDADMRGPEWRWSLTHAVTHIRWLHPYPGTSAIIETRVFPSKHPCSFFAQVAPLAYVLAAQAALRANAAGKHTLVSVNPRWGFSGKKKWVSATVTIVLDLDADKLDIWATVTKLAQVGILPSMLLVSGNGIHFYIRLAAPVIPAVDGEAIGERLAIATGSDHGFDCCRMDRLAGSINHKTPATRAYIAGIWPRVYQPAELNARADALGAPPGRPSRVTGTNATPLHFAPTFNGSIPADIEALLGTLPSRVAGMIRTGERPSGYTRPGNSGLDFLVICTLLRAGLDDASIVRIYSTTPVSRLKAWRAGPEYFPGTLANCKAELAQEREQIASMFPGSARPAPAAAAVAAGQQQSSEGPKPAIRAPFPDWDESVSLPRPPRTERWTICSTTRFPLSTAPLTSLLG